MKICHTYLIIFYTFQSVAFIIRLRGAITMHSDIHSGTGHARMLLDYFSPSERNHDHGCGMQP